MDLDLLSLSTWSALLCRLSIKVTDDLKSVSLIKLAVKCSWIDYGITNQFDCGDDNIGADGFVDKILLTLIHPSHFAIARKFLMQRFYTLNCK